MNTETKELPNFRDMIRDGLEGPCKREAIEFVSDGNLFRIVAFGVTDDTLSVKLERHEGRDAMGESRWHDRSCEFWVKRAMRALLREALGASKPTQLDIA